LFDQQKDGQADEKGNGNLYTPFSPELACFP
jgi:hypothetical protein